MGRRIKQLEQTEHSPSTPKNSFFRRNLPALIGGLCLAASAGWLAYAKYKADKQLVEIYSGPRISCPEVEYRYTPGYQFRLDLAHRRVSVIEVLIKEPVPLGTPASDQSSDQYLSPRAIPIEKRMAERRYLQDYVYTGLNDFNFQIAITDLLTRDVVFVFRDQAFGVGQYNRQVRDGCPKTEVCVEGRYTPLNSDLINIRFDHLAGLETEQAIDDATDRIRGSAWRTGRLYTEVRMAAIVNHEILHAIWNRIISDPQKQNFTRIVTNLLNLGGTEADGLFLGRYDLRLGRLRPDARRIIDDFVDAHYPHRSEQEQWEIKTTLEWYTTMRAQLAPHIASYDVNYYSRNNGFQNAADNRQTFLETEMFPYLEEYELLIGALEAPYRQVLSHAALENSSWRNDDLVNRSRRLRNGSSIRDAQPGYLRSEAGLQEIRPVMTEYITYLQAHR